MSDSLFNALLASSGPSQSNRLLALHTPLGPDVLLAERMQLEESIGPGNFLTLDEVSQNTDCDLVQQGTRKAALQDLTGYRLWVTALSTNANLALNDLRGKAVNLDWKTDSAQPRCVHGLVTRVELLGSDGGLARYALRVEPGLRMLSHQVDSWVFQNKTAIEIIDELLGEQAAAWGLSWRWLLADRSVYPKRSICVQYEEHNLAFFSRLLAEEGLFYWFEHSEGGHTLVIADHAALLDAHSKGTVRFTQSGAAVFKEDSLKEFEESCHSVPTRLVYGTWDYRAAKLVYAEARTSYAQGDDHVSRDIPGAYAFENSAQAQRLATRHLEALQMPGRMCWAKGTWRSALVAKRWRLKDHPCISPETEQLTLAVRHRGRNNITAEQHTALIQRLGALPAMFETSDEQEAATAPKGKKGGTTLLKSSVLPNQTDAPLYECELILQEAQLPVRAPLRGCQGVDALYDRPRMRGVHTAVVVGSAEPIYTDRDNRVRVQFHWQRGERSSHRLGHVDGSNAPGAATAGTWVRVMQPTASVNSGEVFTPRRGQEVVISYVEEDVDRPVVIGGVYTGQGQVDAQGNKVSTGPSGMIGNAGPWFPGNSGGHAHGAVLSGFKTQSMEASQSGGGAYNQLVLDDTPKQPRTMLGTQGGTQASWLNLGHLLLQVDNQRLDARGHGLELMTTGQGALRAGKGIHLSSFVRPGGTTGSNAHSMEASQAIEEISKAQNLVQTLAKAAQDHKACLPVADAKTDQITENPEPPPKELPVSQQHDVLLESLKAMDSHGYGTGGGAGETVTWARPEIVLSGPGIALTTAKHAIFTSGSTTNLASRQDVNLTARRNFCIAVSNGISWFTYGQPTEGTPTGEKPNTETGMQLHAANGLVSLRANKNQATLKARQDVTVTSMAQDILVSSPTHVLLTAGGSGLRIEPGKITISTTQSARFKAGQRVFTSPQPAQGALSLPKGSLARCALKSQSAGAAGAAKITL